MSDFEGFPEAGIQFLRDLRENNNREWWEDNKQVYIEQVREPALQFVTVLGERIKTIAPNIHYDLRVNGSGSLMRPYRDVRFSADKSPYKTTVPIMWWEGSGKKMEHPGFGFQISLEGNGMMGGIFGFPKDKIDVYREAVLDDKKGPALVNAIEAVLAADDYSIEGQHYKRVPRGYDKAHPRANWLRYTGLWASSPEIPMDVITSPQLVDVCFKHCQNTLPVQQWLADVLN